MNAGLLTRPDGVRSRGHSVDCLGHLLPEPVTQLIPPGSATKTVIGSHWY